MTLLDRVQLVREMICHEDELVNNRVTWFLITQGILFGAFGAAGKALITQDHPITDPVARSLVISFVVILCVFGFYMSLVVGRLLSNANRQLDRIDAWYRSFPDREGLPEDLRGSIRTDLLSRTLKVEHIPTVVALIWLALAAVSVQARYALSPSRPQAGDAHPHAPPVAAKPPNRWPRAAGPDQGVRPRMAATQQ